MQVGFLVTAVTTKVYVVTTQKHRVMLLCYWPYQVLGLTLGSAVWIREYDIIVASIIVAILSGSSSV